LPFDILSREATPCVSLEIEVSPAQLRHYFIKFTRAKSAHQFDHEPFPIIEHQYRHKILVHIVKIFIPLVWHWLVAIA